MSAVDGSHTAGASVDRVDSTAGESAAVESQRAGPLASPPKSGKPLLDDRVARRKFDRQVNEYHAIEPEYRGRGWLLLDATFPEVSVAFAALQVPLRPVVFGCVIDFTNYDYWPLSVRFIDPFTLAPLTSQQMPPLIRMRQSADGTLTPEFLLVAHADQRPFMCVRGVREYHEHPHHSNDPWLAYRNSGVGTLVHVLDIIYRHGILPLSLRIQVQQAQLGLQPDLARAPR